MKGNLKLIVSDLDGTLLNSRKLISDTNREAIKEVKKRNIDFTICTGRMPQMVEYYVDTLHIDAPFIAANGALIWDPNKNKPIQSLVLHEYEMLELLSCLKLTQTDYSAYTLNEGFFCDYSTRIDRFVQYNSIANESGYAKMKLSQFDEKHHCLKGQNVYKILIYETDHRKYMKALENIKTFEHLGYTTSEGNLIDVGHKDVSKGNGLMALAEILGLQSHQICAIGDYVNDISMLTFAGYSVAMGNGLHEVKEAASFTTRTNDDDGVAWAIENYLKRHLNEGASNES